MTTATTKKITAAAQIMLDETCEDWTCPVCGSVSPKDIDTNNEDAICDTCEGGVIKSDKTMAYLERGGQVCRTAQGRKFFYKIKGRQLMCRVNELGGWHSSASGLRLGRDILTAQRIEYKSRYMSSCLGGDITEAPIIISAASPTTT